MPNSAFMAKNVNSTPHYRFTESTNETMCMHSRHKLNADSDSEIHVIEQSWLKWFS